MAGGNRAGNHSDLLNTVTSVVIDKNGTMFICDHGNRRVQRWFKNENHGQTIIADISCWGLAMDYKESIYISHDGDRVSKWPGGVVVAGGNGAGAALNQLHGPCHIFVDKDQSVFVADTQNHRVMKWPSNAIEGIVLAGGNGAGNSVNQLNSPFAVIIDQMDAVYVVEHGNHRVTRWFKGAKYGSVIIGGRDPGNAEYQLLYPHALTFDQHGNIYVADTGNHRIQMFAIDKSSCV